MSVIENSETSEPSFNSSALNEAFRMAGGNLERFACDLDAISSDIRTFEEALQAKKIGIAFEMEIGIFFDWETKKQIEEYEALVVGEIEYLLWAKIKNEYRLCYKRARALYRLSLPCPEETAHRVAPEETIEIKPLIDTKSGVRMRLYDSLSAFVIALGNMAARKNLDFSEYDCPSGNHQKVFDGYQVGRALSQDDLPSLEA